jgi:hypothetical protein
MPEHATQSRGFLSHVREAGYWALAHRRKIASGLLVALPVAARIWPEFPADSIAHYVRLYFGA